MPSLCPRSPLDTPKSQLMDMPMAVPQLQLSTRADAEVTGPARRGCRTTPRGVAEAVGGDFLFGDDGTTVEHVAICFVEHVLRSGCLWILLPILYGFATVATTPLFQRPRHCHRQG
mmetsp:Transcript_59404/g.129122  ORF Transcript_59404/g.129122 Transcript_59404/m.129122 type:complete len:116 (-) Transcript_59404:220-567(-)